MTEQGFIEVRKAGSGATSRLAVERTAIGQADDYKPNIALMPDGELLIAAFHQRPAPAGKVREDILLFRSADAGRTWSEAEVLGKEKNLLGREPYLTVLKNGVLLMTVHHLANEERNETGHHRSYLHRSEDGGRNWTTTLIEPEGPDGQKVFLTTSRNVLERKDGSLMLLAAGDENTAGDFAWISRDNGKTWPEKQPVQFVGKPAGYPYGLIGESHLWQARSGRIIALARVDHRFFPIPGRTLTEQEYDSLNRLSEANGWPPLQKCSHCGYRSINDKHAYPAINDQLNHLKILSSVDGGKTWELGEDIGDYGMMYPAILRLQDGRLLLTFTVRHISPPLGVRAILGTEQEDGITFNLGGDIFVIDAKTPLNRAQGGGFGPTIQLKDGTLVTAYSYRGADNLFHPEVARWRLA